MSPSYIVLINSNSIKSCLEDVVRSDKTTHCTCAIYILFLCCFYSVLYDKVFSIYLSMAIPRVNLYGNQNNKRFRSLFWCLLR